MEVKVFIAIAKFATIGLTVVTSIMAFVTAFACWKGSSLRKHLNAIKWLLVAILLNLIIN